MPGKGRGVDGELESNHAGRTGWGACQLGAVFTPSWFIRTAATAIAVGLATASPTATTATTPTFPRRGIAGVIRIRGSLSSWRLRPAIAAMIILMKSWDAQAGH